MIVSACFLACLLDLLGVVERRYAVDFMPYQCLPDRWIAWGLVDPGQSTTWLRYLMIRLPSYSWEYNVMRDDFAFGQCVLLYMSGRGWRKVYTFE